MNPTLKQKRFFLIAIAVVLALAFIVRFASDRAASAAEFYSALAQEPLPQAEPMRRGRPPLTAPTPPTHPALEPAEQHPPVNPVDPYRTAEEAGGAPAFSPAVSPYKVPPEFAAMAGPWRGTTAIDRRGVCTITLVLQETFQEPGRYTGNLQMKCSSSPPLTSQDRARQKDATQNHMNPEASRLSGMIEDGTIKMKADKILTTDSSSCGFTALEIVPFGNRQIAISWKETEPCTAGGSTLLSR